MNRFEQFDRKFFPVQWLLLLGPIFAAWYLFIVKEMQFPPLDLTVYRRAADFLASGDSPYSAAFTTGEFESLPWVYTPFASLLTMPLHYMPIDMLFPLWTVFAIVLPLVVLTALSYNAFWVKSTYSKGEKIAALGVFVFCAALVGSVVDTFALGQIGILLSALTLYDLAAPERWFRFRNIHLPRGVLAGIAGAIKLVPLIVIPYWIITKQWRAAIASTITVAIAWGVAFLAFPKDSLTYFLDGKFMGTNGIVFIQLEDNQSLIAGLQRLTNTFPLPTQVWVPIALSVVLIGLFAARQVYRNGDMLSAGIIVGLTSALASPVSWVHHFGWLVAVPGAVLAGQAFRSSTGKVSQAGWLWFVVVLVLAFPPTRYSWSPLRWIEWDEHYNILSIAIVTFLWWRSGRHSRLHNV